MPLSSRDVIPSALDRDNLRGDIVKITAGICTVCTCLFFSARILVRWPLWKFIDKDDYMATAATVVLTICAVNAGLGKNSQDLPVGSIDTISKLVYASDLIYVLTTYLAKIAVALFFLRLAPAYLEYVGAIAILVAGGLFGLVSLILVGTIQHVGEAWVIPGLRTGRGIFNRWIAVEVMGDAFELILLVYPTVLVMGLNMPSRNKFTVIMAFLMRTPIIALSVLRLISLSKSSISDEPSYAYATTQIYTQVEMCLTVISATIICMRIFLMAAQSGIQGIPGLSPETNLHVAHGSFASYSFRLGRSRGTTTQGLGHGADSARGGSVASAARDRTSTASSASQTTIVARKTVDIYHVDHASDDDEATLRNSSV